jgi:hypothetical protein
MSEPNQSPPYPPVPDTPTIPLSALLRHPGLGLRHIAGPIEDQQVGMVQASELDDPAGFLLGGELLLTAGVHFPDTGQGIDAYVRRLAEAGIAALAFGVAPVHAEVPPELTAACDRHGLPLLRVPPHTPFVAVARAAHLAMAEARNRDLRRISEAQAALASAAARPDAVEAVLRQLAARLGAWAVLLDAHGNELLAAGERPAAPAPERLRALAARTVARHGPAPAPRSPMAAAEHLDELHLVVQAILSADSARAPLTLGLATGAPPGAVERSTTGVAVVLLSLLTDPRHAVGGDSNTPAALVRLMLGATAEQVTPLLHPGGAGSAQSRDTRRWMVVHGRRTERAAGTAPRLAAETSVHLAALGTALGTPHLDVWGTTLRALVPCAPDSPAEPSPTAARLGWTLGLSAPVRATDLALADSQAERELRRALATGIPVARHPARALSLHGLVSPADAVTLARTRFAPLADAGPPGAVVLLETLRTWLVLHGSWDRTAAALEVHRNTVRQRIARIATLLDADLGDTDVRMELWFALRWLPGEHPPGEPSVPPRGMDPAPDEGPGRPSADGGSGERTTPRSG